MCFQCQLYSDFLNCHLKCKPACVLEGSLSRPPRPEHGGLEAAGQGSSAQWGFQRWRAMARWAGGSGRGLGEEQFDVRRLIAGEKIHRNGLFSINGSGWSW